MTLLLIGFLVGFIIALICVVHIGTKNNKDEYDYVENPYL